jgi:hypothetical protein
MKEIIKRQNDLLVKLINELVTIKAEFSDIRKQLADELKQIYIRLDEISIIGIIITLITSINPNLFYVDIVRSMSNSLSTNLNFISSIGTILLTMMNTLFYMLDMFHVVEEETSKTY